jgi:putative membrane protein
MGGGLRLVGLLGRQLVVRRLVGRRIFRRRRLLRRRRLVGALVTTMARRIDISAEDRARIRDAVEAAEAKTAGEIFTVIAGASDDYRLIPVLWATLAALLVPLPILLAEWLAGWTSGDVWNIDTAASTGLPAAWVYATQLAVFILLAIVLSLPRIRPLVVPRSVKDERAHAVAVQQFLAHGLHLTEQRTGVLIFVSLAERYAEIIADAAIAKKVEQAVWDDAMSALLAEIRRGRLDDGLVAAVERVGVVLAEHFPPRRRDENELSDDLVIL